MPFGLKGGPATFQRLNTSVLGELNWEILLIYLDDIIYSRSFEEHLLHLQLVFNKLRAASLKMSPSKCVFARTEVRYLGFVVSSDAIKPILERLKLSSSFRVLRQSKKFVALWDSPRTIDVLLTILQM